MGGGGVSEDGDPGFQIAPMVDVVFVLLLFFMAAAGSQVIEKELNVSLPSGKAASAPDGPPPTPIMVEVRPDGHVVLNNKDFGTEKELTELRETLKGLMERYGGKDPVVIQPSPETRHERIIDVLNAASASGVKKLTFS